MPDRSDQQPVTPRPQRLPVHPLILLILIAICVGTAPARAEVRTVSAEGQHRMGDRDTREDAVRLATESAKRNALEQVATYLESVTVVDGMNIALVEEGAFRHPCSETFLLLCGQDDRVVENHRRKDWLYILFQATHPAVVATAADATDFLSRISDYPIFRRPS
ncbi:MAG: hypothetical protein HP498_03685 [Nitrospira sp.]|nr:hypothetical protein [Nitrospira sp.]